MKPLIRRFPNLFVLFCMSLTFMLDSFVLDQDKTISFSTCSTIREDYHTEHTRVHALWDTACQDSLYIEIGQNNIPIRYYRPIKQEVCFDKKCRLMTISIYWNITGRYLGFKLVDGEFLSKREHEPFSQNEYTQLHNLLADPHLPLNTLDFEGLMDVEGSKVEAAVDGVSGATAKNISDAVVKGAAYTTYALWNIVHGPTRDCISTITKNRLSPALIVLILQSCDVSDQVWGLGQIDEKTAIHGDLKARLLEYIGERDFSMTYLAINALQSPHLGTKSMQDDLFDLYEDVDHAVQRMIVRKLMQAPYLSSEVTSAANDLLSRLNGAQVRDLLALFAKHDITDQKIYFSIAKLLDHQNRFISKQAFNFLDSRSMVSSEIRALLDAY